MKNDIYSSNKRLILSMVIVFLSLIITYVFEYNKLYKSIKVSKKEISVIEYGSSHYDIDSLTDMIDGDVVSIKKNINPNKVGNQKLVVLANKDGVEKEVELNIQVKDTIAPEIKIKEDSISLTLGEDFDILSNIESVYDKVDGDISYQQKEFVNYEVDTNYYTIEGNIDPFISGTYPILIRAVDKYGNESTITYHVIVKSDSSNTYQVTHSDTPNDYVSFANSNSLIQLAYSLIGSPYVVGGNNPSGFDCSGFVQYLYNMMGVSISRSSSTQIYDGVGISYEEAQPGDILSWGYVDGIPTHSALYVGEGKMIHATNPRDGVILSDVSSWIRGSGMKMLSVRRI